MPAPPTNNCTEPHMVRGQIMTLAQIQQHLQHTHLELIKMDIEGFVIPLIHSWWRYDDACDLSCSNDDETSYPALAAGIRHNYSRSYGSMKLGEYIQTATDFVMLQSMLLDMGYVVVSRDDNPFCKHCSELVFVRIPPSQLLPQGYFLDYMLTLYMLVL